MHSFPRKRKLALSVSGTTIAALAVTAVLGVLTAAALEPDGCPSGGTTGGAGSPTGCPTGGGGVGWTDTRTIIERDTSSPPIAGGGGSPYPGTPGSGIHCAVGPCDGGTGGTTGGSGSSSATPTTVLKVPNPAKGDLLRKIGVNIKSYNVPNPVPGHGPYITALSQALSYLITWIPAQGSSSATPNSTTFTFQVTQEGTRALTDKPLVSGEGYLNSYIWTQMRAIDMVFTVTGRTFDSCSFDKAFSNGPVTCTLRKGSITNPSEIPAGGGSWNNFWVAPTGYAFADESADGFDIPVCLGVVKDGGPGVTTEISIDDVKCKTNTDPASKPVRLWIDRSPIDPENGLGYMNFSTHGLTYAGKSENASGKYWFAIAYAETSDGFSSLPFKVFVRNHYVPKCSVSRGSDAPEAIRTVKTTVVSLNDICRDKDVDDYQGLTSDVLTAEIVGYPAHGSIGMHPGGKIEYRSDPDFVGRDWISLRVRDRFGLQTKDIVEVPIDVVDLKPTCNNVGETMIKDSVTTLKLQCTRISLVPLTFDKPLDYEVAKPVHGKIGSVDLARETVTYTPDPGFTGVDTFMYTARNGAASRTAQITVNVLER